jgi:enoyl-CoA hydratase
VLDTTLDDGLWVVTLDDGGHNALRPETFDALLAAFDDAPDEAGAILLSGRPGMFSAGLDVKWMQTADVDSLTDLLLRFGRTLMRVWAEPRPTVAAVTGHAVAAGTMFAMACDHAVASAGDWRFGLTETRIDFQIPDFALELTRRNVGAHHVDDLLLPGALLGPDEAAAVGYVDEVVAADEVLRRARAHATELAALPQTSYRGTKHRLRGDAVARVLDGLEADVAELVATSPVARR